MCLWRIFPTPPDAPTFGPQQAGAGPSLLMAATSRFNMFERGKFCQQPVSYGQRDFYKLALVTGTSHVIYAREPLSAEQGGYFRLFTKDFLGPDHSASLQESLLFQSGSNRQ